MKSKIEFLIVFCLVFIISSPVTASAREITVDDNSGADFVSIQEAVNNSVPGDKIIVRPGTYTENVLVNVKGLTIMSEPNNEDAQVKPLNESVSTFMITADNITISGLNIIGPSQDSEKNAIFVYGDMNNLTGNTIENGCILLGPERRGNLIAENKISNGKGEEGIHISCCGFNTNIVSNNTISNCSIGIYEYDQAADIRNNRITDCDYGIELAQASPVIDNNTILNCDVGILLGEGCPVDIINNTILSCSDCGIFDTERDGRKRIYNNYFNNSLNVRFGPGEGGNTWNNSLTQGTNIVGGPYIGGNFWAKPDGNGFSQISVDLDGNGIGDLPYNIYEDEFDYLPLTTFPAQHVDGKLIIKEIPIVTNESDQQFPTIYGDSIVWMDWRNGDDSDIYMYDLSKSQEIQITNNYSYYGVSPIYGDRIVWSDSRNGNYDLYMYNNYDIYMYNITTHKETQITTNESNQRHPSIFGDRIVWEDDRNIVKTKIPFAYHTPDIYMYDFSTSKETRITSNESEKEFPTIYGDKIIWFDSRSRSREMYMYDLSTHSETQITFNKSLTETPAIYGDRIVWSDSHNGNFDIYMYNFTTHKETQITTNESEQHDPAIYGDRIVWTDYRNILETKFPIDWPTPDIYMYNISTSKETRITTSGSARNPSIYKDRIVYEDWRNGNFDIYMCILSGEESKAKAPIADFSANPTSGYAPLAVQFTDLSQNAIGWNWRFGDGATSTEQNPKHAYSKAGNYTVNLTATNANSRDSKLATITVLEKPVFPVANFSSNVTQGYAPLSVQFTDLSKNATAWNWDFENDGIVDSTYKNSVHTYTVPGYYTVNLTAINANGTASKLSAIAVFNPADTVSPVANFSTNVTQGPAPLSVQFTDLSQNTTLRNWNFGDGAISTEQNPMHTYSAAGNYTVNLTASNGKGTTSKTLNIIVEVAKVLPVADFIANTTSGYAPLSVQFSDLSQNANIQELGLWGRN